jgi:hypothetical protein
MSLIRKIEKLLAKVPEKVEYISKDALTYWLRRERQVKMDQKGWAE